MPKPKFLAHRFKHQVAAIYQMPAELPPLTEEDYREHFCVPATFALESEGAQAAYVCRIPDQFVSFPSIEVGILDLKTGEMPGGYMPVREMMEGSFLEHQSAVIILKSLALIDDLMRPAVALPLAQASLHPRPIVWERKGDTLVFKKLSQTEAREHASKTARKQAEALIKRRDHGVRGHWRTYRSGRKVWVRAHRRGDPALGTITSVMQVEG